MLPLVKHVLKVGTRTPTSRMVAGSSPASPSVDIEGDDEAILFYTLGVLGKNKGVVHTHWSFLSILPIVVEKFELERDDVCWVCSLSTTFWDSGWLFLCPFGRELR
jgi:acyl-coenzyme A synthetase/AMP-(fatty) acid ligase